MGVKKKYLTPFFSCSNIQSKLKEVGDFCMDEILKQALLYDFYGELLTAHQKEIYEEVVLEDCSLSEVAEAHGISRQGVHDLIKRCQKMLEGYEEKLKLVEKFCSIKERWNRLNS